MQSKKGSVLEVATNIAIGYTINFIGNMWVLPQMGFEVTFAQNLKLGLFFTTISIVRAYVLRRIYNKIKL